MITAAIIQARYGSSRLPGKVLETIGEKTVLARVIERCRAIPSVDVVVCAVAEDAASDPVAQIAIDQGAIVVRGSQTDVLDRYVQAARAVDADVVLRVTSDCPLIDPDVCERVICPVRTGEADYSCNNMPPTFPHGLDCEAFSRAILEEAGSQAQAPFHREHVTPWIRENSDVRLINIEDVDEQGREQRWTLDYPEDLVFLRALIAQADKQGVFTTRDLIAIVNETPDLAAINQERHGLSRPASVKG